MIKIAGNTNLTNKNHETNELLRELERVKEQIERIDNAIDKYIKLTKDKKNTLHLKRQQVKDNLNIAKEMNINVEVKKKSNKEEIDNYKEAIEKVKQSMNYLEINFQSHSKELARKSAESKQNLTNAKYELERLNQKMQADRTTVKILTDTLQKADRVNRSETSVINPMTIMNSIQMKETMAAKKIQVEWSKYKQRVLDADNKMHKIKEPVVLIKENRDVMTPPDVFEESINII